MKELIEKYGDNMAILEEAIDIKLQKQYFKESKKQKVKLNKSQVMADKEKLFDNELSDEAKRELLCQLASLDEVEAFRTIENYKAAPDEKLADWAILAFQESKMLLQSSLMDEKPVFISTGLGGDKNRLRYFIVLFTKNDKPFESYQLPLVESELKYIFGQHNGEIEELNFCDHFVCVTGLVPLNVGLKKMLSQIIAQCNEIGDFLQTSLLVTNVKKLSVDEILKLKDRKNA